MHTVSHLIVTFTKLSLLMCLSIILQVSAVTDGPHDAGLCQLKSYQLLHETQLPQTECAMLCVTMNGRTDAQA